MLAVKKKIKEDIKKIFSFKIPYNEINNNLNLCM